MAANNALKKIQAATKKLRKEHPKMTYQAAQKKAGAMYRSGTLGATRKKAKVSAVKVGSSKAIAKVSAPKRSTLTPTAIAANMNKRIDTLEKERKAAGTKTEKHRIQRKINSAHDVLDALKKL